MTPKDALPNIVLEDIKRYRSYRWKPSLIVELVYRRHGRRISQRCLKALADGAPCPRGCRELCRVERAAPAVPELPRSSPPIAHASILPLSHYLKK